MAQRKKSTPREDRLTLSAILDDLSAIYREVDDASKGRTCPASTECCRFGVTGREPYVTSLELLLIERAIAARGGIRTLGQSPPPLDTSLAVDTEIERGSRRKRHLTQIDERICPLLDAGGRCSVYASRPFGCRTYFCGRASGGAAIEKRSKDELVRRIKALAEKHMPGGDLGRPLSRALSSSMITSARRR